MESLVSRTQKKGSSSISATYGQVNAVDLGYHDYKVFSMVGGSEELSIWNIIKRTKGATISSVSSSIGATTAARICPKQEFVAFATGTDWCKGLYELEGLKRPKISVIKLATSDMRDATK